LTAALRLPAFVAALLLLSSCSASGTPRSGSTPSTSFSAGVFSSTSSSTSPPATSASITASALKPVVVHIRNFAYVPASLVVVVGQPIEIVNDDVAAHTWSAAPGAGWAYSSGNLEKGQRATFPGFTNPGSYRFLCYYHAEMPLMNGVVTVKAAA
jgi:plastocyanin